MSAEKTNRIRFWALVVSIPLMAAAVWYEHNFYVVVVACGTLAGRLLWRAFGRQGRRWLLLAVGLPVAMALAGLAVLAQSQVFPHSPHQFDDFLITSPIWVFMNILTGWMTNPEPGQQIGQPPRQGTP